MNPHLQHQIEEAAFEIIQRKSRSETEGIHDYWMHTPVARPATDGWPGFVSRNPDLARVVLAGLMFMDCVEQSSEVPDDELAETMRFVLKEESVLPFPAGSCALTRAMSKAQLHGIAMTADPSINCGATQFWRKYILAKRIPAIQLSEQRWQLDKNALIAEIPRLAESDKL